MKTTSILVTVSIAILLTVTDVDAQRRVDAPMILEKASHAQMVEGNLDQAISLYRQVALSATASRNYVAQALVALGNTYELQGSPEAIPTYERVVSEFSDQPKSFIAANAKLNNLALSSSAANGAGARKTGGEFTVVLQEMLSSNSPIARDPRQYDFSPDGKEIAVTAATTSERKKRFPALSVETYIRDTSGSVGRPLVKDPGDWEYISRPRWSPDGKYIVYRRAKSGGMAQFMLFNVETQQSRQLTGDLFKPSAGISGGEWMPDSNGLMVQFRDGFRIMGLDGVEKKYFSSRVDHMTQMGNVSPDGRYMLFHKVTANKEDHHEMDIWQLDLESDETSQLSDEPGYEGWPVWNRDGTQIYYVSGPEAARNVYRRKPGSDESPVKLTAYNNASAAYPRITPQGGQLTFALHKDNHEVLTADTDALDAVRTVVRGSHAMLSPEGQTVYYIDNQPGRAGLWRVAVNSDNPQQLVSGKVLTSYTGKTLLSPDGSHIAYSQYTGDTTTLFVMPSAGGTATSLYTADGMRHLIPSWSPNGKEISFSIDGELLVVPSSGGDASILASVKNWESWNLEWSPDGQSIAGFAYLEGEESNHIMVVDRNTKKVTRVTPKSEGRYKELLAWHPDGDRISYMYYNAEDGNGSRIVSLETSQISDLSDMPNPNWDYIGIWGPDQHYYFKVVREPGSTSLYAFNEDSQDYREIRHISGRSISLPSWSVDGSLVAWSEKAPVRQVWMMTKYE